MSELPNVFYQPPIKIRSRDDLYNATKGMKKGETKILAILCREVPAGEWEEKEFEVSLNLKS